jgi:hypothetical protein
MSAAPANAKFASVDEAKQKTNDPNIFLYFTMINLLKIRSGADLNVESV